jgi:Cellulase (glycosyl hydrolase family 5)
VIATTIPISTKMTIAACSQIHVGDIDVQPIRRLPARPEARPSIVSRMHRTAAALAIVIVAACVPATADAAPSHLLEGVNVAGISDGAPLAEADRSIAQAHALHARVVRVEAPWSQFMPQARGQIDARTQAYADRLIADAAAAGIGVILITERTPCWVSSAPASLLGKCRPLHETRANDWPPSDASAYAEYVAYLAARYGPRLAAIEVWNEPDQANEDYFAGPHKPERYAAVLRAAYAAIKQVDPNLTVLGGSLVGSNGRFLKQLYAAGIKGFYDGLAVHFYNLTLASVRAIHETQLKNGDTKPLWLDEFGWSSCYPGRRTEQEQGCVSEAIQARNLVSTLRELARAPYVAAAAVYKLQDSAGEHFGVLKLNGRRKPSFAALSGALAAPLGAIPRVTLSLEHKGNRVLAQGSGPIGDYMGLEVHIKGTLRYRVLFTLNRFNRYSIKLPSVLGTHGLQVRVFQYWLGRARAATKSI